MMTVQFSRLIQHAKDSEDLDPTEETIKTRSRLIAGVKIIPPR